MAERPNMSNGRYSLPFAAWELRLYLDTHPDDTNALEAYRKICAAIGGCNYPCATRQGMSAANGADASREGSGKGCGCSDGSSSGRWEWIDDPWPWEPSANVVESED